MNFAYHNLTSYNIVLQNCFSAIRGRLGYTDHPTTRHAAATISILSTNNFLRRQLSNSTSVEACEEILSAAYALPPHLEHLNVPTESMFYENRKYEYVSHVTQIIKSFLSLNDFPLEATHSGSFWCVDYLNKQLKIVTDPFFPKYQ